MKTHIEVEVTIKVPVTIYYEMEADDDGCGDSRSSGNSMTGVRGKAKAVLDRALVDITEFPIIARLAADAAESNTDAIEDKLDRINKAND